ncbi:hypothetical protein KSP40_PGU009989 [Platanthera guangdongensis]|uniref:CUE domain-containing protein n=1 Tax=Platanthera guangdongensis TaxID=2320717 RepID=A0ABR2LCR5_9ASPA
MVAGIIVEEVDLCRRVFVVLYRISSNREPGVRASDCLSVNDHTALLQEKKLLDLPKLLDICAIYGHENGELTKLLVANAIKAQPQFLDNLVGVVSHFLSIVHTLHGRCNTSLELLASYGGGGSHRFMPLSKDFLEVLDFINDSISTFDAFADAYRPAALHFCLSFEISSGNGEILNTLARLHDSLIPSMLQGFLRASNMIEDKSGVIPDVVLSLKMLLTRIVKFGWKLLDFCYLHYELAYDDLLQGTTKMFPASVVDPSIRGDILVQTLKEINGEAQFQVDDHDIGTFVENIEKNYRIFSRINSLCSRGWILLDQEQLQYLSRILRLSSSISTAPSVEVSSCTNQLQKDEDAVLLDSKISQIKDLFPDYGKGFLMACLEVYNHDTEEVIQRILEGTLHQDLSSLNTSIEHIPPANQTSHKGKDKGKAVLVEPSLQVSAMPNRVYAGGSSTLQSSFGHYTRKSNDDKPDSEVLDSMPSKDAVRTAVLAAEIEYEDEYDDSFDDLGLSTVESGFEEPENLTDRMNSLSVKSSEPDQSSSSRWNSSKKPLFYVKDGKNYSYKVSGSVGVASAKEAAVWNQTQKELIHGLGRGGNLSLGAAQNLEDSDEEGDEQVSSPAENTSRAPVPAFRGRGGRRGGGNHHRKDRALKKHFSGLTGY